MGWPASQPVAWLLMAAVQPSISKLILQRCLCAHTSQQVPASLHKPCQSTVSLSPVRHKLHTTSHKWRDSCCFHESSNVSCHDMLRPKIVRPKCTAGGSNMASSVCTMIHAAADRDTPHCQSIASSRLIGMVPVCAWLQLSLIAFCLLMAKLLLHWSATSLSHGCIQAASCIC